MIQIEINGIKGMVLKGDSVIEAAKKLNIPIPRFCYHDKLSVSANCRMCLVEIEKMPKLVPACATFVVEGMKIWTRSSKAIAAQKAVLEFLLINHPLDCPVCDKGGECELQDLTISYGFDRSNYREDKRVVSDSKLGLIVTDMTRCILCSRCVRFGEEILGVVDLGIVGRGEKSRVTTYIDKVIGSELAGNVIDICPVGALTSKLFRYKARSWELRQYSTVSIHDCIGSNLYAHSKNGTLMRIVPRANDDINDVWISDRDRFSYEAIYSDERLLSSLIKENGVWKEISLTESLLIFVEKVKNIILCDVKNIGFLASPNSTIEEFYLLQKIARFLNIDNIDHRLFNIDFSYQDYFSLYPCTSVKLKDIEYSDFIFLLGSYINKEQPIVSLNINKAILHGAKICSFGEKNFNYPFKIDFFNIIENNNYVNELLFIINFLKKKDVLFPSSINFNYEINIKDYIYDVNLFINDLLNTKKGIFIIGMYIYCNINFSKILFLVNILCNVINFKFILMSHGSNSCGGWISGFVPHRLPWGVKSFKTGYSISEMFLNNVKNYVLFGIEPSFDIYNGDFVLNILKKADYVIAFSVFKCKDLLSIANLLIPISSSYESSGTFINIFGNWQSFNSVAKFSNNVFPGWKILSKIGSLFGFFSFDNYKSSFDVLNELCSLEKNEKIFQNLNEVILDWKFDNFINIVNEKINNINFMPLLYNSDYLVRRAKSLYDVNK